MRDHRRTHLYSATINAPIITTAATQDSHPDCRAPLSQIAAPHTLPVLDAAHIRAYGAGGEHEVSNGLLLRTDIHKLFDRGYVTVDPAFRFVVSSRLREDFQNGKHYYDLAGQTLRLPAQPGLHPSPDALSWHRQQRFLG